jgi:polyhydroxybutyrate depolymerase
MKKMNLSALLIVLPAALLIITGCSTVNEAKVTKSLSNYDYEIQGFHSFEMTAVDGRTRKYTVYVPWSYDGSSKIPVVMHLHGGALSVEDIIQYQSQHNWQIKAEQENFLVVYPLGSRPNNNAPASSMKFYEGQIPIESYGPDDIDKWGNPTAWDDRWISIATGDDVGFIDGLIDQLAEDYSIDLKRVYVSGISNGGMMAWRLAEELNHRLAAVASVVGAHRMPLDVDLQRAVPFISIVGDHDDRKIGSSEGGYMDFFGTPFPKFLGSSTWQDPWQDQIDTWIKAIGASTDFEIIRDDERVTAHRYKNSNDSEFQDWRIHDMGHTWPGMMEPGIGPEAANPRSDAVIGEDLIWDFFKRFSLGNP